MENYFLGGKFWRKNYPEEKVWGKDGAKPNQGVSKFVRFTGLQIYLDIVAHVF